MKPPYTNASAPIESPWEILKGLYDREISAAIVSDWHASLTTFALRKLPSRQSRSYNRHERNVHCGAIRFGFIGEHGISRLQPILPLKIEELRVEALYLRRRFDEAD
jgi:hypothetical protein